MRQNWNCLSLHYRFVFCNAEEIDKNRKQQKRWKMNENAFFFHSTVLCCTRNFPVLNYIYNVCKVGSTESLVSNLNLDESSQRCFDFCSFIFIYEIILLCWVEYIYMLQENEQTVFPYIEIELDEIYFIIEIWDYFLEIESGIYTMDDHGSKNMKIHQHLKLYFIAIGLPGKTFISYYLYKLIQIRKTIHIINLLIPF